MNMKLLLYAVGIAFVCASCQQSFDERLAMEAKEYTDLQCPSMTGPDTRIDSMCYDVHTHTLTRHYTLLGLLASPKAVKMMQERKAIIESNLKEELTQNVAWKECIDKGVKFAYKYISDSTQLCVFQTTIVIDSIENRTL